MASDIVERIISILEDRQGFDSWWHDIDTDIQDEILDELEEALGQKDVTVAEESTDNRLLALEAKYLTRVRIRPAGLWQVEVVAYGQATRIKLTKTINDVEHKLSDREIEHEIDLTIERLRQHGEAWTFWQEWCQRNGARQ